MMIERSRLHDAVICKENCTVLEVSRILRDMKSRHLIVVSEDMEPLGIISTVDINNRIVSEEKDPSETKAADIMTAPIAVADINETYESAYQKIIDNETYSIPVVENRKIIGILSFNQLFLKAKEGASK